MLYRRPNSKFWWTRFTTPNGQEVRKSTKTADRKQALAFETQFKAEIWRVQQLGQKPKHSWQSAVVKWSTETAHKATHDNDLAALRYVDQFLCHKLLDEIDSELLDQIIEAKLKTGVANATVNRVMEVVRAILNKAEREWRWIDRAPTVRMLKEPSRRIRWLTQAEAQRLLKELPAGLKAMARFSLATGLREANVTGLEWSQIDMQRKVAWIHADQAKARKAIGVPLNEDAIQVLREQIGKHQIRVFTYRGKPVKKANTKAWRKALVRAGIDDFRWHDLRHTWASWHVQSGTPLHVLQELGSWSDVRMVQRYAHLAPEHLAGYANNISLSQEGENSDPHIFRHTGLRAQKNS